MTFAMLLLISGIFASPVKAAEHTASTTTNRANGQCDYTIHGLNPNDTTAFTLQVTDSNKNVVLTKDVTLDQTNCTNGTFHGNFTLQELGSNYGNYNVNIIIGSSTISAGTCDFTIHSDKLSMAIQGGNSDATRTAVVTSTAAAGEIVVPGTGSQVSIYAWKDADESKATIVAPAVAYAEGNMNLSMNVSSTPAAYGPWNVKLVLSNPTTGKSQTIATGTYEVAPTFTKFVITKSKALEKKKSFRIDVDGLKNVYSTKAITFALTDSKGNVVLTTKGSKKKADASKFQATVSMKKLKYKLDRYTVSATITDSQGKTTTLSSLAIADCTAHGGSLSITKKSNATCVFKLTDAYAPGYIKKIRFILYQKKGGKYKKIDTIDLKKTSGKSKVSTKVHNEDTGNFKLRVYGYTNWNKKIFLNEETYKLRKKDMGKNGWFYEKYAGKKYKFYYINNVKQTDLTDIVGLKESNASNTNKLYLEINRAASALTIFMYNKDTKKYDIPIKTCAISVGSDTWTNLGTSGLNPDSSYTPLGTYSICTNGTSVKYSMKEMHEPDGEILYARWTSHIVGNVYFHSIAVPRDSHYALNPYTYNRLGSPASAGCIRMAVADAKWIYDYASTGSIVKILKGNSKKPGPLGKGATIKVTGGINYDPTDPGVPDSRKKKDYKAKRISGYMTKKGKRIGY